jgi:hypothetical protein
LTVATSDAVEELRVTQTQFPAQPPAHHVPIYVAGSSVLQLDMKTGPAGHQWQLLEANLTSRLQNHLSPAWEAGAQQSGELSWR